MAENRRKALMAREMFWLLNEKDGKSKCLIGPVALVTTGDDVGLLPDASDPTKVIPVEEASKAIQSFVIVPHGKYVVITNPSSTTKTDYPNGPWKPGENEIPDLLFGTKRVITSGHFPLWPGQAVEMRDIHRLGSDDYLIVEVVGQVDDEAPYYSITESCARIVKAVVDQTVESKDSEPLKTVAAGDEGSEIKTGEGDQAESGASAGTAAPPKDAIQKDLDEKIVYKIGQRIVIPGSVTATFIPPTGIELVAEVRLADTTSSGSSSELNIDSASALIKDEIRSGRLTIDGVQTAFSNAGIDDEYALMTNRSDATYRDQNYNDVKALDSALFRALDRANVIRLAVWLLKSRKQASGESKQDPYVRKAKVPGPTQFCVLVDPEGIPQSYKGPGRVFPGPYDKFRTEGTSDGLYEAYHVRPDRGILLRVLADKLSKAELMLQIPSCPKDTFDKDEYLKGDEVFIAGFDTFVVPSKSFQVINPEMRMPHVGNDHALVYIRAIGVDQKSGVYVADVNTGNIPTVKGEEKLLLDPRKYKHIKRRVPGTLWNLMIGHGEPHKMVRSTDSMVETPWALSIPVPNNEAALIVGKDRREVVVGPRVALLNYEEVLEVLTLSTETPKKDHSPLETCFLRISGNRISDEITIETSDFVRIDVVLNFGVSFVGDSDAKRISWFNYKDPIGLLCSQVRSRLKAAARTITLQDLYPKISDFVRDTVLGKKPDEGGHRSGLLFTENNMLINEVEVVSYEIPDESIASTLRQCNREIVESQINTAKANVTLQEKAALDTINAAKAVLDKKEVKRNRVVQEMKEREHHAIQMLGKELATAIAASDEVILMAHTTAEQDLLTYKNAGELARAKSAAKQEAELSDEKRKSLIVFREKLANIEKDVIAIGAKADVDRLHAIQPKLVEALEGLGNKELATALAEHLPQAGGAMGFLLGHKGLDALKAMVPGTILETALNSLSLTDKKVEEQVVTAEAEIKDKE